MNSTPLVPRIIEHLKRMSAVNDIGLQEIPANKLLMQILPSHGRSIM